MHGTLLPEEAAWTARIETLRDRLRGSGETVSFRDYGAGTGWQVDAAAAPFRTVTRPVRVVNRSSTPPHLARLLFCLIRRFRPGACLELGTCLGISAAYQAAALALNGTGGLITLEGGAALARQAEMNLEALGLPNVTVVAGPFQERLPGVLAAHGPFGYAFIDGHHDPGAVRAYFERIAPHLTPGALLVFDDVAWSAGMRRAWRALAADPRLDLPVDLWTVGIGLYRPH